MQFFLMLITISGILRKGHNIEVEPPPKPFPDIKDQMNGLNNNANGKKRGIFLKDNNKSAMAHMETLMPEKSKKTPENKDIRSKRKEDLLKRKNKDIMNYRQSQIKQKTFDFFHNTGFAKTEEEKEEFQRQRNDYKKLKELAKDLSYKEEAVKEDVNRMVQNNLDLRNEVNKSFKSKRPGEEADILKIRKHLEDEKKQKRTFFGRLFGKKEKRHFESGMNDIKTELSKPIKDDEAGFLGSESEISELKFPDMETYPENITKPEEVLKAEEEIRSAIEGIKKLTKKKPFFNRLFRKKTAQPEMVEMPEVMPNAPYKLDKIEVIEGKIHKARLMLMDFKFDDAKRAYIDIMGLYNALDNKKKSKVYEDIKDLYNERKSAEKIAK